MFTQSTFDRVAYFIWLLLDLVIVYVTLRNASREWSHAPHIQHHLTPLFALLVLTLGALQLTLPLWFVNSHIGAHRGVSPPGTADLRELTFWSTLITQVTFNLACVMQLLVRWDSRGHGVSVWAMRTAGSLIGVTSYYAARWYLWPEAYDYVTNPVAMAMMAIYSGCDIAYGVVLYLIQQSRKGAELRDVREKK